MLRLDVLIATHRPEGIKRVVDMDLPRVDGVGYIVSWQDHRGVLVPQELARRDDIEIVRFEGCGVSCNRNNALEHSTADICLMADDDLVYTVSGLEAVKATFERNPEVEMASFMYEGADNKVYPDKECDLAVLPKGFYQTTFEIAVRRDSRAGDLRFDEDFGPGSAKLHAAEDEMFLLHARRLGVKVRFFPVIITRHDGLTTGSRKIDNPYVLWATGAYILRGWPLTSFLRIPVKAFRLASSGQCSFFGSLLSLSAGAVYALVNGIGKARFYQR